MWQCQRFWVMKIYIQCFVLWDRQIQLFSSITQMKNLIPKVWNYPFLYTIINTENKFKINSQIIILKSTTICKFMLFIFFKYDILLYVIWNYQIRYKKKSIKYTHIQNSTNKLNGGQLISKGDGCRP